MVKIFAYLHIACRKLVSCIIIVVVCCVVTVKICLKREMLTA